MFVKVQRHFLEAWLSSVQLTAAALRVKLVYLLVSVRAFRATQNTLWFDISMKTTQQGA